MQSRIVLSVGIAIVGAIGVLAAKWVWTNKSPPKTMDAATRETRIASYTNLALWTLGFVVIAIVFKLYDAWQFFGVPENQTIAIGTGFAIGFLIYMLLTMGVLRKSRIAATLFTINFVASSIYFLPPGQAPAMYVFTTVFITVNLILGTAGIFLYHMLLQARPVEG